MVKESYCIRKPERGTRQLFYLRDNFFSFATTFYLCDNFFIFVTTFLSSQQLFYLRNNIFISATTTNETMCQGSSVNCNNAITFSQQQSNSRQFLGLVTLSLKLWRVPSSDRENIQTLEHMALLMCINLFFSFVF